MVQREFVERRGRRRVAREGGKRAALEEVVPCHLPSLKLEFELDGAEEVAGQAHKEGGAGEEGPFVFVDVAVLGDVGEMERVPTEEGRRCRGDYLGGGVKLGESDGEEVEKQSGEDAGERGDDAQEAEVAGSGGPHDRVRRPHF